LWSGGDPDWEAVFDEPQAKLHLYGKQEARPGRKMGHINCLAEDTEGALAIAGSIRKALVP
jgi:5-(carboxyamino)imidazole ribonucleotide synthase